MPSGTWPGSARLPVPARPRRAARREAGVDPPRGGHRPGGQRGSGHRPVPDQHRRGTQQPVPQHLERAGSDPGRAGRLRRRDGRDRGTVRRCPAARHCRPQRGRRPAGGSWCRPARRTAERDLAGEHRCGLRSAGELADRHDDDGPAGRPPCPRHRPARRRPGRRHRGRVAGPPSPARRPSRTYTGPTWASAATRTWPSAGGRRWRRARTPTLPARAAQASHLRIARTASIPVRTSPRKAARAPGGFSSYLRGLGTMGAAS